MIYIIYKALRDLGETVVSVKNKQDVIKDETNKLIETQLFGYFIYSNNSLKTSTDVLEQRIKLLKQEQEIKQKTEFLKNKIFELINNKCKEHGFIGDGTVSPYYVTRGYKDSKIDEYRESAIKLMEWGELVLYTAEQIQKAVENGDRDFPTWDEMLEELPKFD